MGKRDNGEAAVASSASADSKRQQKESSPIDAAINPNLQDLPDVAHRVIASYLKVDSKHPLHVKSATKRLRTVHASLLTSMDLIWQDDCRPQALASFLRIHNGSLNLTVKDVEALVPLSFAIVQGSCKQLKQLDVRLHRGRATNTPVNLGIMQAFGMAFAFKTMPVLKSFKIDFGPAQCGLVRGWVEAMLQGLGQGACPEMQEFTLPVTHMKANDFMSWLKCWRLE